MQYVCFCFKMNDTDELLSSCGLVIILQHCGRGLGRLWSLTVCHWNEKRVCMSKQSVCKLKSLVCCTIDVACS